MHETMNLAGSKDAIHIENFHFTEHQSYFNVLRPMRSRGCCYTTSIRVYRIHIEYICMYACILNDISKHLLRTFYSFQVVYVIGFVYSFKNNTVHEYMEI